MENMAETMLVFAQEIIVSSTLPYGSVNAFIKNDFLICVDRNAKTS